MLYTTNMKKYFLCIACPVILSFLITGCSVKREEKILMQKKAQALDSYVSSLSLEEKVCQMFIENLEGSRKFVPVEHYKDLSDTVDSVSVSKALVPGGYIFFSYNLDDKTENVMEFTDSIREYCFNNDIIIPFLAIDQEGGLVNRLRALNGPLPSNERVVQKLDSQKAYRLYELQAVQMRALGFDMNLAPVAEICTEFNKDFLNGRSFGSSEDVKEFGKACVQAYEQNGIATVLKHFPGNTNTNPHTGLPEIKLSMAELNDSLEPFYELLNFSSCVLMSHARTTALDKDIPACLSYEWVTGVLKNKLGYKGIIFSDDIFMGALQDNGYSPEKACVMAVESGVDCIMISEKRFSKAAKVLIQKAREDVAFADRINESVKKILLYKIQKGSFIYERQDREKNDYELTLKPALNKTDISERIASFETAKKENIQIYTEYFYNK